MEADVLERLEFQAERCESALERALKSYDEEDARFAKGVEKAFGAYLLRLVQEEQGGAKTYMLMGEETAERTRVFDRGEPQQYNFALSHYGRSKYERFILEHFVGQEVAEGLINLHLPPEISEEDSEMGRRIPESNIRIVQNYINLLSKSFLDDTWERGDGPDRDRDNAYHSIHLSAAVAADYMRLLPDSPETRAIIPKLNLIQDIRAAYKQAS